MRVARKVVSQVYGYGDTFYMYMTANGYQLRRKRKPVSYRTNTIDNAITRIVGGRIGRHDDV